ncbi:MAG TPA: SH3 domain-containing protein, partial [Gemmatimonadaceae bacterium]
WASLVTGDERVTVDTLSRRIRGSKEFDWILTPRSAGSQTVPPIAYPFWNPRSKRYQLAASSPETLSIRPGALAAAPEDSSRVTTQRAMAIRRVMRAPVGPPPPRQPVFAAIVALAPLPALSVLAARRRRAAPRPTAASARLRAATRRGSAADPAVIRAALVAALVERRVITPFDLGRDSDVVRALRRCGVSQSTANDVATLLAELDAASYSATRRPPVDAARRARAAFRAVDAEARDRTMLGGRTLALLLAASLTLLAGGAALAAAESSAERQFASGVHAYDLARYATAAAAFDSAALAAPRAVDAWANAGTAHWAARDTAEAVVGWQKALRLDPLDGEVRERLDLTPGPARGVLATVPPVSIALLAFVGLALWWAAWLIAASRLLGMRRAPGGRWVYALHGLVAAAVVAYVLIDERLAAKSLAVVADPEQLRAIPSLGADPVAPTRLGSVVRVVQREGRWSHVAGASGEDGWIESDRLRSLERD